MDKPKLTVVDSISTANQVDIRSAVDILERALAEAREGNILACAITMVGPMGKFGHYSSKSPRYMGPLIASVGLTHWRLCEEMWHSLSVQSEEYPDMPPDPTPPEAS